MLKSEAFLLDDEAGVHANSMLPGRVRGLSYVVNNNQLLNDIDLDLEAGTKTVIMGANGAGKSLLLRLLHGLLVATTGTIHWGSKPNSLSTRRRQAMVFQRPVLLRRSVQANIEFVLKLRGRNQPARADQILDEVGLLRHAKRAARQLSGGEQQRLALARALALEPRVLFLDEPTANLDPAAIASIESIINTFHLSSTKIVLVTHDIGQARRLSDEVVFLHRGQLIEQTAAATFFTNPTSDTASSYLAGKLVF